MKTMKRFLVLVMALCLIAACSPAPAADETPTPTSLGVGLSPEDEADPCEGLSGSLEMRILVGPAEVAGLEPVAVGMIPFTVTDGQIEGGGVLSYQDVLEAEWGTYSVTLDMLSTVDGSCTEDGLLIHLEASGEQMLDVQSEGFQGQYPWAGTHQFDLNFPLENGAVHSGEGWSFVLHLGN